MNMLLKILVVMAASCGLSMGAMAQETRQFTAENGTFDIPVEPQRIVALNDQILTLPLYEMGASVVGSAGRLDADGNAFLRGGMDTLGIDFPNTDIEFVGLFNDLDVEAIAALEPDLIIGGVYNDAAVIDQLQTIAPTLVINNGELGLIETLRTLADASGTGRTFEARYQRYRDNVERLKTFLGDPSEITATLTFMFPEGEELWVYKSGLGAISHVLADLGVSQPAAVAALDTPQISYSAELIQDLDADFVFGFYRQQPDATPQTISAAYETFAPGWCQALTACQNGQFVLLPGPTFGSAMASLDLALEMVEAHMAGRPFVRFEDVNR
ncbi:ABC transporter substrate-binding protein [Pelagibacterium halotolerans]|uniref:Putative iron compound-binding protein of ABC transporter family n=1 Tax=Pelagibacterium halotolerans (strain DSM 22347 / JCM 15775 / CGMCC 1.7692 / B2) TaxID=1082931 RepID=G4R8B3_PELHB|nr:ABC transporter substrate-binding protein [Pelagibacterium halotolerans]AEQ52357.1 putative iron compound-binding protein of ABC transporter family [Pelagibacterium halotolerans B2]QJR17904.1 ABC transporter substrate-binding protein [Pelagibacterium halotolerans]SEA34198.1 iron complex transport system substrate-binding protein [Pelagibacterium halotolerans]